MEEGLAQRMVLVELGNNGVFPKCSNKFAEFSDNYSKRAQTRTS